VCAAHTEEQLDHAAELFQEASRNVH
jgi:hypothetical protein